MYERWLFSIGCWMLFALAVPASVHASPAFSPLLERAYELPCEPTCLVCHTQPQGGFASANTKLGITLRRMFDLQCCDTPALEGILAQLEQGEVDSDGDGATDVQELRAMTDPNLPDVAGAAASELACQPPTKDGGCALVRRGGAAGSGALLLGCALLWLRRLRVA
jgi:hypothetical protein